MQLDRTRAKTEPQGGALEVRAWDLPTRLFHWSLVALIAMAYVSRRWGDAGLVWHTLNGYAVLILITWRILWGFVGSSTSRFSSFIRAPRTAVKYGIDFVAGRPRSFLGHNPLGGLAVLVLLGMVGAMGVLGLFSYDDQDSLVGGPLSGRVSDAAWAFATRWHLRLFDLLLWVIGLHVLASVIYLVWKRENLVRAMITGRKRAQPYEDQPEARVAASGTALACLAAAAVFVLGGIKLFGGKLL